MYENRLHIHVHIHVHIYTLTYIYIYIYACWTTAKFNVIPLQRYKYPV